ncbi:MAG: hypothetical protein K1X57_21440, partial [Gemmataceae bacterium]|nr:hypothetical protein [Gemmataceae bacterium]
MRRRTVLIPVLTFAALTTTFSWWLWRDMPLQPVRSIVLPMPPIHGTLTVTNHDDYCLLNNFVMLGSFPAEVKQCIFSLRTGDVILGPGGLERTAVELSKTHPWAYMRVGLDWDSADSNSPDRDLDCYALDLNTWDWRKVFWGSGELESNPFHCDVDYDYYGRGETKTKRWHVLIPELDDRIWNLIEKLVPSRPWLD